MLYYNYTHTCLHKTALTENLCKGAQVWCKLSKTQGIKKAGYKSRLL